MRIISVTDRVKGLDIGADGYLTKRDKIDKGSKKKLIHTIRSLGYTIKVDENNI